MYALNTDQMIQNAFSGLAGKPTCYLPSSFTNYHQAATVYSYDAEKAASLAEGIEMPATIELRTTDNAQVVAMGTQAQQDLQSVFGVTVNLTSDQSPATYAAIDQVVAMGTQAQQDIQALGFTVNLTSDQSPATYAIIDQADESWDILIAPGDPSCFGGDTDLLLNWWFGDNIWMQTRCAWNTSEEWKQVNSLMATALTQSGADQQDSWNQVFDILADQCVLYPVLQVITPTASWSETASPAGTSVQGFSGIGTTGVMLADVATVTA